jgi:hypothetical protein
MMMEQAMRMAFGGIALIFGLAACASRSEQAA